MGLKPDCQKSIKKWTYILVCLTLLVGCADNVSAPNEDLIAEGEGGPQPYFGLDFPSDTVTRFAPAIFKKELHGGPVFTPDGKEVYWSFMEEPLGVQMMRIENGAWTEPARAPFDRGGRGDSPFISSDGNHLLYLSRSGDIETIWQVDRADGIWGSAHKLPDEVNGNGAHWQAAMADNGNLYFGSKGEIYFAEFVNGNYSQASKLNSSINTPDAHEGSPFVAPDESYLIFDRAPHSSYADLYITFRDEADGWGEPISMEALNSGLHELYPNVSPDGRFIMFLSNRVGGILLPYWVDAEIIEEYRVLE